MNIYYARQLRGFGALMKLDIDTPYEDLPEKTREFLIDRDREEQPGRSTVPVDPADIARRKEIEHKKLRRMVAYADSAGCLRATILRYFGDPAAREAYQKWVQQLWLDKDAQIAALISRPAPSPG